MPRRLTKAERGCCKLKGCHGAIRARGMCGKHYERWRRTGDALESGAVDSLGRRKRVKPLCSIDGCDRPHDSLGLCGMHYQRLRKHGDPEKVSYFKGDGHLQRNGYRLLYRPEHPNATVRGYVMEHVVVMSEALERPLEKDETVHHRNGVRYDNRLANLELWVSNHPKGQRVEDVVAWAHSIIARYGGLDHVPASVGAKENV